MRNREYDHLFKLVIVGNSAVGKSCLLLRFADDQFSENYMTTIGVDFRFKTLNIDQKSVKLQIWDTAGQERFRTITNTYYKSNLIANADANAVLLVYDITNMESFQDIEKYWLNEVESYADPGTQLVLIGAEFLLRVGNKCDLEDKRAVPVETARLFAQSKNMEFYEASAKTAKEVSEAFTEITRKLYQKVDKNKAGRPQLPVQQNQHLERGNAPKTQGGYCC